MTNKINLTFKSNNNQFSLIESSVSNSIDQRVAALAGAKLKETFMTIQKAYPTLHLTTAKEVKASLRSTAEGSKTYFYMQLTVDGIVVKASTGQPTEIKLPDQVAKDLIGPMQSNTTSLDDDWVMLSQDSTISQKPSQQPSLLERFLRFFSSSQKPAPAAKPIPPSPSKPIEGPRPLLNLGNDCFLNAVFQVVMNDPLLLDTLLKTFKNDSSPAAQAFKKAVQDYKNNPEPLSIINLRHFIKKWGSQEDASEFLFRLTSQLNPSEHPQLFIQCEKFYNSILVPGFKLSNSLEHYQSSTLSHEFLIPLQIPSTKTNQPRLEGQTLIDTLQNTTPHQGEVFRANNALYQPISSSTMISAGANRLAFQLNRFNKNGKIENPVDMPELLMVNDEIYMLKSMIVHIGKTAQSGHYYSVIRQGEKWIKCNDSSIECLSDISSDRMQGYIYFYEKT